MSRIQKHASIVLVAALTLIGGIVGGAWGSNFLPAQAANLSWGADVVGGVPDRIYNVKRSHGGTSYVKVANQPSNPGCYEGAWINLTISETVANGHAVAWGSGGLPATSNVNFGPHPPYAFSNASYVDTYVSSNGSVYLKVYVTSAARIIVDLHALAIRC